MPTISELWEAEMTRKAERKAAKEAKAKAPAVKTVAVSEATGLTPARVPPRVRRETGQLTNRAGRSFPVSVERTIQAPASARPLTRTMPIVPATPQRPSPTAGQKTLRAAARAVLQAFEDGDLGPAVQQLEIALGEGGTPKARAKLRNQFHPASYRLEYPVTLTGDELRRLQLLTNAPSLAGPIGLTTYAVKPEEMSWARDLLARIRETA